MYIISCSGIITLRSGKGMTPAPMLTLCMRLRIFRSVSELSLLMANPTFLPLQNKLQTGSKRRSGDLLPSLQSLEGGGDFSHSSAILSMPEDISLTREYVGIANSSRSSGGPLESSWMHKVTLPFRDP
ncbi:hypothetical protein Mapa_015987 [Marchantia paleacea]|nr:hypothetical protein Mapa_015987 [Marchantia paleacea]